MFTGILGFGLSKLLGFGSLESVYVALALTFSSTIIVVKLLSEKRDLNSLYGKVAIGFLLVQDLVAMMALILVVSIGVGGFSTGNFIFTLLQGSLFIAFTFGLSRFLAPYVFNAIGKNTELLFLFSIAWVMVFASLAAALGFSIAIGAFVAGVGLSTLKQENQIASKIRPLRDLFIVIFFISLGLQISFSDIINNFSIAIILSIFVLVANPLIMMFIMGRLGFRKRTSFMSSVTLAQISEFSLILVALGLSVGHLTQNTVNIIALVAIITIGASSYLILHSSKAFILFGKRIPFPKGRAISEKIFEGEKEFKNHVVLVGAGRLGGDILKSLKKGGKEVLVVDFDPSVVRKLIDDRVDVVFGDIADKEIIEKANIKEASLLLTTMHDSHGTKELLDILKEENIKVPIVTTASDVTEALVFYKKGVSYVIVPRLLSSQYIALMLAEENIEKLLSGKLRDRHMKEMSERIVD
ncbi:cation:proton antiporter [Patescibacteria group bacterium]|nr:cation:proton antiporter [Patescibacteria group bacterium]